MYKDHITKKVMTEKEYRMKNISSLRDVLSFWKWNSSYKDLSNHEKNTIDEYSTKLGRSISEAVASKVIGDVLSSDLIYSNIRYSANKGEAKGIDLCHFVKGKFFIIEVKFTENHPSSNFSNAKKQLESRFNKDSIHQLQAIVSVLRDKGDVRHKELSKIIDKYIPKADIDHKKEDSIIPTASVVTGKSWTPRKVKWLYSFVIEVVK